MSQIADDDDMMELLERPGGMEQGPRNPPNCLLERNGFSNTITILDANKQMEKDYPITCATLRRNAEIGIIFLDLHNAGKNPFWHQAIEIHARRAHENAR